MIETRLEEQAEKKKTASHGANIRLHISVQRRLNLILRVR